MMPQYVLGVNISHDRSSCLLRDGELVSAIAEERLDRIKHSVGRILHDHARRLGPKILPWRGITYCLDAAGLSLDDLALIMIDRAGTPVDPEALADEIPIRDKSKIRAIPHPSHHIAHATSAYFCSPFEESAVLVADNIGSYANLQERNEGETGFHAVGHEMKEVFKTWSEARDLENDSLCLGRIYRMASLVLGFYADKFARGHLGYTIQFLDDAGKTMGLAPYGKRRRDWPPFVVVEGGELRYPHFISWLKKEGLLKPRIQDGLKFLELQFLDPKRSLSRFHRDLAFKVQEEVEKGMIFLARRLHDETGSENLCIGGGVGLNSVANYRILKGTPFKRIFIQPAATDDGTAVGAAFYGWTHFLGGRTRYRMRSASLGRAYSSEEVCKALFEAGVYHFDEIPMESLLPQVARWIAEGKIVGWFQGGSEFGPRALGNRSILADPRRRGMKDLLNRRVKFRESFRPYAPSVLAPERDGWFELDCESPFMLLIAPVRREKRKLIPAVTHVDGTARLQTVTREENGVFYDLIAEFQKITGVPIVLNTSFNIRGMPIVETPADAIDCFKKTEIDHLVIGNIVVPRELYPEEELRTLVPVVVVKINREPIGRRRRFWIDIMRQELHRLTAREDRLLALCDGRRTVGEIAELGRGRRLGDFIDLFRRGLIFFRNPFSPDQPPRGPGRDQLPEL